MAVYGYVRTSTRHQNPALQIKALWAAGVTEILEAVGSGAGFRPVLEALLALQEAKGTAPPGRRRKTIVAADSERGHRLFDLARHRI